MDESNQYNILRGLHVNHSMKNLLPLNTEVCVSIMSGFIKRVRWDCKADLVGRCSHVAAVLLMLSNYILENGHVVERTSTSLLCSWNEGKNETKSQGNFTSQCMNPVTENILVICTIGIHVNIEDSLVRTGNSTFPYL